MFKIIIISEELLFHTLAVLLISQYSQSSWPSFLVNNSTAACFCNVHVPLLAVKYICNWTVYKYQILHFASKFAIRDSNVTYKSMWWLANGENTNIWVAQAFQEGHVSADTYVYSGRPSTATNNEIVKRVHRIVWGDRTSVDQIVSEVKNIQRS